MTLEAGTAELDLLQALLEQRAASGPAPQALIAAGLSSASERCMEVAVGLAARDLRATAPLLLLQWPSAAPGLRAALLGVLRRDPLLVFEPREPARVGLGELADGAPAIGGWFSRERVMAVLGAAAGFAEPGRRWLRRDTAPLRGLFQLLAHSPHSPLAPAQRSQLAAELRADEARRFRPELAIVPSYSCNLSCAYCFSSELAREFPGRLDAAAVRELLATVDPGGELVEASVFGGEPTLLPDLPEIAAEIAGRGMSWYFATNGACPPARFDALTSLPGLSMVTLHVDPPTARAPAAWDLLRRNAALLAHKPLKVVLRYNLVDATRRDWEFLAPLLAALPLAHFSFAVVFPSTGRDNDHVPLARLAEFAPKIVRLVRWVAERRRAETPIVLAKPFPACVFDDAALTDLLARIEYRATCELFRCEGRSQLQIHPDRTLTPCMALTAPPYRVRGPTAAEARRQLSSPLAELAQRPLLPACSRCPLFDSGSCQAACYAYS